LSFDDNAKRLPHRPETASPPYATEIRRPADPSGRRLAWRTFIELPIVVW